MKEDSGKETKPVVRTPTWLAEAKHLNAEERAALLERIIKELEGSVEGNRVARRSLFALLFLFIKLQVAKWESTNDKDLKSRRMHQRQLLRNPQERLTMLLPFSKVLNLQNYEGWSNKGIIAEMVASMLPVLVIFIKHRPPVNDAGNIENILKEDSQCNSRVKAINTVLYTRNSYLSLSLL